MVPIFSHFYFSEREGQVFIHSLTDAADRVFVNVVQVCGDEMGVISAEALDDDLDLQCIAVAQIAG